METMQLNPVRVKPLRPDNHFLSFQSSLNAQETTFDVVDSKPLPTENKVKNSRFIEANTSEVTLNHLLNETIVPVFSKDNELTISHPRFIEAVHSAASKFFVGETIDEPDVRVSHVIKGRVPEAIHKPVNLLLDTDKTIYYERMAFMFEIPTIYEDINGNRLTLSVGGVRAYNHENLFSKKSVEKFKVFVGFKNRVCTNLCISTDGFASEIRVSTVEELSKAVFKLLQEYNPARHLHLMSGLKEQYMTEQQFAQLIGKTKLYHCLPYHKKKTLPSLDFTDTHINMVAKSYYQDDNFKLDEVSGDINLWNVYNLFTGANKSSYIDNFLDRSLNATELIFGVSNALHGDNKYKWFVE